jgi:hypothetical protein
MPAMAAPAPRSARTLARRAPIRSTIGPPTIEPIASGTVVAKAAMPVRAGLPVVTSTNHGSATTATTFPSWETVFATTRA